MLTLKQMRSSRRKIAALQIAQDRMCLRVQGFVIVHGEMLNEIEYCQKFRRALHIRLTNVGRTLPYNRGNNAARAAEILKHGAATNWFASRDSIHRSGDDMRGIRWYLLKWERERGLTWRD